MAHPEVVSCASGLEIALFLCFIVRSLEAMRKGAKRFILDAVQDMNCPLKDMVRMLVELIGGRAAANAAKYMDADGCSNAASNKASREERAMGETECAAMARMLLNLILELFGAHQFTARH